MKFILINLNSQNKTRLLGWLKPHKFLMVEGLEDQDQDANKADFTLILFLACKHLLCSHDVFFLCIQAERVSLSISSSYLNLTRFGSTSTTLINTHCLQRALSLNVATQRIRASTHKFYKNTIRPKAFSFLCCITGYHKGSILKRTFIIL